MTLLSSSELLTLYGVIKLTHDSCKGIAWVLRQSLKTEHQIALYAHHRAGHKGRIGQCDNCTTVGTPDPRLQTA